MNKWVRYVFCLTLGSIFLLSSLAFAINGRTTYQAKIYKPDGTPLESVSVNFRFTVLDPSSSCVLYVEDYGAVNMIGSGGLTSFSLGMGSRSYPASGPTTFANVFDNSTPSFVCQLPGVYNPVPTDNRKIVMQFNDGGGWQTLPAMAINSVPYAMYATKSQNSEKLNGKADTSFVEYSTLASLNCQANEAIKFNGANFACISVGSGVTSSSVTTALGYTPVNTTSFTALSGSLTTTDSNVASVSSAVFAVSSTVSTMQGNFTSFQNAVAASFAVLSGNGVQSLNGSASMTQTFATGVAGTAFNISTANGVHTFNIPNAASASVTAGLLSNADYLIFTNKLSATSSAVNTALGYTPANQATVASSFTAVTTTTNNLATSISALATTDANLATSITALSSSVGTSFAAVTTTTNNLATSISALATSATNLTSTVNANTSSITALTSTVNTNSASITGLTSTVNSHTASLAALSSVNSSQWTTNGSNIYFTSGSVGVGTSAPAERLTVGAGRLAIINTAVWDHMALYHTGANAYYDVGGAEDGMIFRVDGTGGGNYPASSYTEAMRLMPNGRVGIGGVSNPTFTLDVSSSMRVGNASGSLTTGSDGNAYMELREHDNNGTPYIDFVNDSATDYDARLILTGDDALQLNGAYLGIGVMPTAGITIGPGATSYAPLKFTSGTLLTSPQSGTMEYDGFAFYLTDGANQRRMIATGSPQGSFDGVAQLNSPANLTLYPAGSVVVSSPMQVAGNLATSGTFTAAGNIVTNGSLGVGQTNPGEKLDVNGNMRIGSGDSNYIAFRGTTGDGPGSYNHTYIGERFYAAGESSELFLFKGNDSDNASGPDRIRMAGGNILFDTYNTPDAPSGTFEAVATSPMISTKMIIKGNGNVGIGHTSPSYALDVSTTTSIPLRLQSVSAGSGVGIRIDGVDSGSTPRVGYINWSPVAGTNQSYFGFINQTGTNLMSVRADGNVGIGTTNPTMQLTTTGDALVGSGGYPALYLRDSFWWMGILRSTDTSWPDSDSLVFNSPVGRPFVFQNGAASQTEGIARMYIDGTNGNVGIGTTTPSSLNGWGKVLDVFGAAHSKIVATQAIAGVSITTGVYSHGLTGNGYAGYPQNHGGVGLVGTETAHDFAVITNNTARISVTSAGTVGINTIAPQAQLDVNGSIRGSSFLFYAPPGDPAPTISTRTVPAGQGASNEKTELILFHSNDFNNGAGNDQITLRAPALSFQTYASATVATINDVGGYNERMYITPTGEVGVGTTNPSAKFSVNGGNATYIARETTTGIDGTVDGVIKYGLGFDLAAGGSGMTNRWHGIDATITAGAAAANKMLFKMFQGGNNNNAGAYVMTLQGDGNVGIGTSNPTTRLEVAGGDINVPTGRISFNSNTTAGTAGMAATDSGAIFGEHDVNSELSRLVIEVADNHNDQIVLRTNAPSGGANVDMVKVQYDQIQLAPTTGNVGIGVPTPTSKLHVNGGIKQPNYGVIWVTFDGTTRIVTMPAFLTDAYMNAHQDETFTWRAGGPTLKDAAGCNAGPNPNYQFNNVDSTWAGTYRMTIGQVNGTNVVDLEWAGWGVQLLDATFSVIPTNSNEGSVHATLAKYGGGWTVEHMGGQVGVTPFACH